MAVCVFTSSHKNWKVRLTKSLGSANPHNVVRATIAGLDGLKDPVSIARLRGKELAELTGARV